MCEGKRAKNSISQTSYNMHSCTGVHRKCSQEDGAWGETEEVEQTVMSKEPPFLYWQVLLWSKKMERWHFCRHLATQRLSLGPPRSRRQDQMWNEMCSRRTGEDTWAGERRRLIPSTPAWSKAPHLANLHTQEWEIKACNCKTLRFVAFEGVTGPA